MSDADRKKILGQVQHLADIANPENGAFPGEIANAAALMQKLMDQYNIQWVEVMATKIDEQNKAFMSASSEGMLGIVKRWHWSLARAIGRMTGTRHYATGGYGKTLRDPRGKDKRGQRMTFFGNNEAVGTAIELYDKWVVLIDRMGIEATAEYCQRMAQDPFWQVEMRFQDVKQFRHLKGLGDQHPNVFRNSWLEGVANGINAKLYEQEKQRTQETSSALMVLNTKVDEAYGVLSKRFRTIRTNGNSGHNHNAYSSGYERGKSMNLNQGNLGHGPKKLRG